MMMKINSDIAGNEYDEIFEALAERLGGDMLAKRLYNQANHAASIYGGAGRMQFHPENSELLNNVLRVLLEISGMAGRAERNSLDLQIVRNDVVCRHLPDEFNGFKILQLSDIHIDGFIDHGEKLCDLVSELACDLCVITGDFRFLTHSDFQRCVADLECVVNALSCPMGIYGILGNHDFIEMVPFIENTGVTVLLNENVRINRGSVSLVLAGIDDTHFYDTGDIVRALDGVSRDDFTILLAHSPDNYNSAADAGVDFCLSGHTHGGQLCLPGGIPIITNANCPRKYAKGPWKYKELKGYTSRGTGSSGIPARFFCSPEITVHHLLNPHNAST